MNLQKYEFNQITIPSGILLYISNLLTIVLLFCKFIIDWFFINWDAPKLMKNQSIVVLKVSTDFD